MGIDIIKNMTVNELYSPTNTLGRYWSFLYLLSDSMKLRLAALLTSSVADKTDNAISGRNHTDKMIKKHFGAWQGEETTEDLMATIRENSSIREPLSFE